MKSPHLAPSRGGRQVRVPAPRRRCREGARPRARADLGSSVPGATPLAPRDRTPARHFGVSRCGPGAHRKRKDGFRGLRYSHAHHRPHPPPPTRVFAPAGVSKCPAGLPHPGVGPGCRQKAQFRSPSLGLTRVPAAPRRRLSPASVLDLGPRRPPPRPRLAACLASRLLLNRLPTDGGLFYREVRLARTPISESHH